MSDKMYDELELERVIVDGFGINLDVQQVIAYRVSVSQTALATLFLTTKKQLYLYVSGQSKLSLGDIKKIVSKMGLKAEGYLPPKNQPKYFDQVGERKFREVFPGRKNINNEDLRFYRTLVPYNPALVLICEVKNGFVYQFDSDSASKWRVSAKFAYKRIKTV